MATAGDIPLADLLQCLVECSKKAARIAQIFRDENDLFQLLVEEKAQLERNKKFVQDFKTLADVLVQETIKRDVGERYPSLVPNIRGEEQNSFQNSLGESIHVELTASPDQTSSLLNKVLDGRDHVAKSLASVVHSSATTCKRQYSSRTRIPAHSIGIWIDPIDSTAEYIQAKSDDTDEHGIQLSGLKCVCVLIGVYELESGRPIIGVVNQPFYSKETEYSSWECRFFWAVNYNSEHNISPTLRAEPHHQEQKIIVLSGFEDKQLQDIISTKYKVVHTAGSGHKSLLVACQKADLYVLSMSTTHFWDTCGPHALLGALGGGMVKFDATVGVTNILNSSDLQNKQLVYKTPIEDAGIEATRNAGGFIAYRNSEDVMEFLQLLRDSGYLPSKQK